MTETIIFRITDNSQFTIEELKEFAQKHSNIVLIKEFKSYNPEEGPHYHGWFNGNLTKKTLIHYFKSELHCKGNADYSVSQKELKQLGTINGYYRYCCKGENRDKPPTVFYNIKLIDVLENHKNYYLKQDEFETNNRNANRRIAEIYDYVEDKLIAEYEGNYSDIPLIILKYYNDKSLMISDFQVESYYNYIRSKLEPDYIIERANRIYQRVHRF